jgi:hypothetical protein
MKSPARKPNTLRSNQRSKKSRKIFFSGILSSSFCRRCRNKRLPCFVMDDNRCSECVRSGVEKRCDVRISCTDKLLLQRRSDLSQAIEEAAAASAKVADIAKEIAELEVKSRKELDLVVHEDASSSDSSSECSENESGVNVSEPLTGDYSSFERIRPLMVDASVGTDPVPIGVLWSEIPIEGDLDFLDGTFE